jgi:predicted metal-dependent hydrolase
METKDRFSIRLDGKTVTYSIRRSRRAKRIRMTIEDDGRLMVTMPIRNRLQDIPPTLNRYKKWILKKIQEAGEKKLSPPFELENGSILRMLDFSYKLSLKDSEDAGIRWRFYNGALNISSRQFSPPLIYRQVELWYTRMAQLFLEERVPFWAERLKVNPKTIRVKNQRTLWGSCSVRGNLNFNWRILLLSQGAAEYLIVHELAHLREPNHSPKFWKLVETHCPRFEEFKNEIKGKNHWLKFPENPELRKEL